MQGASARVTAQLYFAAANLLKRIDSETEARGDLMHKVEQVHEGRLDRSQIDEEAVKGLQRTVLLLETEMVRLDEQIALFNDM